MNQTEASLLSAVVGGDDASHEVYADWLEERDHLERAELLRLNLVLRGMRPYDPQRDVVIRRLRVLRACVDPIWCARVEQRAEPIAPTPQIAEPVAEPPPRPFTRVVQVYVVPQRIPRWIAITSTVASCMLVLIFALRALGLIG